MRYRDPPEKLQDTKNVLDDWRETDEKPTDDEEANDGGK